MIGAINVVLGVHLKCSEWSEEGGGASAYARGLRQWGIGLATRVAIAPTHGALCKGNPGAFQDFCSDAHRFMKRS